MNLIFEGPDNVGKSTTITNIRNHYNETAFQNIYYTGVKMEEKMMYSHMINLFGGMWNILKLGNIISDRSHLSESVFAKLYRNQDTDILFKQEKMHMKEIPKTFLIMLIDTPNNLLKREDGLSHSQCIESKQKEIDLYLEAYEKSLLPKFIVDVDGKDPEQVKEYIIKKLETHGIIQ